jgi:DNA-binding YbaB/EbfC family protein
MTTTRPGGGVFPLATGAFVEELVGGRLVVVVVGGGGSELLLDAVGAVDEPGVGLPASWFAPPQDEITTASAPASTSDADRRSTPLTLPHRPHDYAGGTEGKERMRVQPGGLPDMQQILEQAQKMQQQLLSAQEELADAEVTGTAGGGLVVATVSGAGELKALTIDPKVVDPEDTETLADLVVAAVRDASGNAQKLAAEKMGPLAGGLEGGGFGGLGLPGL